MEKCGSSGLSLNYIFMLRFFWDEKKNSSSWLFCCWPPQNSLFGGHLWAEGSSRRRRPDQSGSFSENENAKTTKQHGDGEKHGQSGKKKKNTTLGRWGEKKTSFIYHHLVKLQANHEKSWLISDSKIIWFHGTLPNGFSLLAPPWLGSNTRIGFRRLHPAIWCLLHLAVCSDWTETTAMTSFSTLPLGHHSVHFKKQLLSSWRSLRSRWLEQTQECSTATTTPRPTATATATTTKNNQPNHHETTMNQSIKKTFYKRIVSASQTASVFHKHISPSAPQEAMQGK